MPIRPRQIASLLAALAGLGGGTAWGQPHNVIIFVADGLRAHSVTPDSAPALAQVRDEGVRFENSHSLFPTVTTPNASAIATGHQLGDTGDFGNNVYAGDPLPPPFASRIAPLEEDPALALMNRRFGGDYLGETSLLQAARAKGYSTAAIGKLGPTAIQDVTALGGEGSILIDDDTGTADGPRLPADLAASMKAAGLPAAAPDRGLNSWPGAYNMPGVRVANVQQQDWFAAVATRVLLPRFKAAAQPFVLVFWSRDPDGTQHNQGDSLNALEPGINGPTSRAAVRNASDDLQALLDALKALGLDRTTDVFVTSDHGFATASRQGGTSASARLRYPDTVPGFLPTGFLAIDMAAALDLPLYDSYGAMLDPARGESPKKGALLGADPRRPQVVITSNGGADLIYLPGADARALAARVVAFLTGQDYTAGVFLDDELGPAAGALPLSRVGLVGSARTPRPSIIVAFRSFSTGCADPELCAVEIADTDLQQGQGIHGTFGRQDTHNFMAAIGPDFRRRFTDPAPAGNADIAPTLARVLDLDLPARGGLRGRILDEALEGGAPTAAARCITVASAPAANGFVTMLQGQSVKDAIYFDAAGMPGRVIGLDPAGAGRSCGG